MCWDCKDNPGGDPYKIFTQGGVPIEDFDDPPHRHPKRKKKKEKPPRGCPENDYKAHVYVWVRVEKRYFWRTEKVYIVNEKTCCGCGKVNDRKYEW